VTISGRIDTSYGGTSKNASDTSQTLLMSDVLTSNEIVIAGSEDIGGGLKAAFRVATPFASDAGGQTGTSSSTSDTSAATAGFFNFGGRGMTVGVSGSFGTVLVGRSAGTTGNSVMASSFVGNIGNLGTINSRPNNSIDYVSPTFNGFSVRALYAVGNETLAAKSEGMQTEFSGQYSAGPLLVRAYYGTVDTDRTTGASTANGATATSNPLSDASEMGIQVNYDFGVAAVNARYISLDGKTGNNADVAKYGVGVRIPFGQVALVGDYASFDLKGVNEADDSTILAGGVTYDLSKRTNLYAVYSAVSNAGNARRGPFGGSATSPAGVTRSDANVTGYAIGIRHNF